MAVPAASRAQSDEQVDRRLETLFGEAQPYREFFIALKQALAAGDRQAVADMVEYPLRTRIAGKPATIPAPDAFLAHYDELMTPAVSAAVEKQRYGELFANSQGVMIGDGKVWFSGICGDPQCTTQTVRIIAINN